MAEAAKRNRTQGPAAEPSPAGVHPSDSGPAPEARALLRRVAHELRTPLNTILGFSDMMACEVYGPLGAPQYREHAEIVRASGRRLLTLVEQVLELARLEYGVAELEPVPCPLDYAFDDVLDALHPLLGDRGVPVRIAGQGELPAVLADRDGLRSLLGGLLRSALAASAAGQAVQVRCRGAGGAVLIAVSDEGPQVADDQIDSLTRPFAPAATGRDANRLDLALAYRLAAAMGGRLRLAPRPGGGLSARLRLPAG